MSGLGSLWLGPHSLEVAGHRALDEFLEFGGCTNGVTGQADERGFQCRAGIKRVSHLPCYATQALDHLHQARCAHAGLGRGLFEGSQEPVAGHPHQLGINPRRLDPLAHGLVHADQHGSRVALGDGREDLLDPARGIVYPAQSRYLV